MKLFVNMRGADGNFGQVYSRAKRSALCAVLIYCCGSASYCQPRSFAPIQSFHYLDDGTALLIRWQKADGSFRLTREGAQGSPIWSQSLRKGAQPVPEAPRISVAGSTAVVRNFEQDATESASDPGIVLRAYRLDTGQLLWSRPLPEAARSENQRFVGFSSDQSTSESFHFEPYQTRGDWTKWPFGLVVQYDLETGKIIREHSINSEVDQVFYKGDQIIVKYGIGHQLRGNASPTLRNLYQKSYAIWQAGTKLISYSRFGTITVFDQEPRLKAIGKRITDVDSPMGCGTFDDSIVCLHFNNPSSEVRIYSTKSGRLAHTIKLPGLLWAVSLMKRLHSSKHSPISGSLERYLPVRLSEPASDSQGGNLLILDLQTTQIVQRLSYNNSELLHPFKKNGRFFFYNRLPHSSLLVIDGRTGKASRIESKTKPIPLTFTQEFVQAESFALPGGRGCWARFKFADLSLPPEGSCDPDSFLVSHPGSTSTR